MTRLASRQDKESMSTSVEVPLVKREYVSGGITCKSLLVAESLALLVSFPIVIGLGSCGIPVVKDLRMWILFP
jgi:hypothetical protein